ncbi:MAG: adenosine deaminase [Legionellaceae bacterium]|nr:adenosine deaminase [Legionellaceae bacterium]
MLQNLFKSCLMAYLSMIWIDAAADVNTYFNSIKTNPNALYAFFKTMPTGGELHYHFSGSSYPEDLIKHVRSGNYCVIPSTLELTPFDKECEGVHSKTFFSDDRHYPQAIRAWSMTDFIANKESNHDHFFSVFGKVAPVYDEFYTSLLAEMMQRAANQHELYMEVMMMNLSSPDSYAKLTKSTPTWVDKKHILLTNKDFQKNIKQQIDASNHYLKQVHHVLGCDTNSKQPVCSLDVRFQFWVKREESRDSVFAQALTGFAAAAQSSNIVGVNLVQPERGVISTRDFNEHMRIFEFLHAAYPQVHIALHAGELEPNTSLPHDLSFHIRNSVYIGHAERIGHGVDIVHEDQSSELVKHMAKQQVAVEINLTSNRTILSIFGNQHPILYYLQHGVPIVLSTDDEGILHTDLTRQYVDAAFTYGIDYQTLKNIDRNSLTYSFLSGKSIWVDPAKSIIAPACRDRMSLACREFIKTSDKARLQWALENKLSEFEATF